MLAIPEISDVEVAFPAHPPLPEQEDIPERFWSWPDEWVKKAEQFFFKGGRVTWKDGIDEEKAMRVVRACLGSCAPTHEHKIAGVAYMLSEWAEDVQIG